MTTEQAERPREVKTDIRYIRDNFQNFKPYQLRKAQLVIGDIPYNVGANAYGSSTLWYNGGDIKNGLTRRGREKVL